MKRLTFLCGIIAAHVLSAAQAPASVCGGEDEISPVKPRTRSVRYGPRHEVSANSPATHTLVAPAQAGFLCGDEGELPCVWPFGSGCHSGLAVGVDLLCHANLGGDGELAYFGFVCDAWHTINPAWAFRCLACGGEGQIACLNLIKDTIGCHSGRRVAADLLCHAECGGENQVACFGGVCDHGNTLHPFTFECVECGGDGQLLCANLVHGPIGCNPGHTLDPGHPALCIECGGHGQYMCVNVLTGEYYCDAGHTWDPDHPLRCTECGGEGQWMCLNLLTGDTFCNKPWLRVPWTYNPDSPSDFLDWLANPSSLGRCEPAWNLIEEPDCDVFVDGELACEAQEQPEDEPLFGIADTHAHPFSNLAFGGGLLWGSVFDERGINAALAWCDVSTDFHTETGDLLLPISLPTLETPNGALVHYAPLAVLMALLNAEGGIHSRMGPPSFDNWPNWDTTMHQQAYYKWMQRAYKGGLRLMVMLAVNSEVSCRLSQTIRPDFGCDDMSAMDRQLDAAKALEAFIDREYGGPGQGWFRIVYTPEEAREAIRSGKMAVVLGAEMDALFECKRGRAFCTEGYIRGQVERYYDKGLRHVFPMHLHDNAFGGSAIYFWLWPWANIIAHLPLPSYIMELEACGHLPENSVDKYDYVPAPGVEEGHESDWLQDVGAAIEDFLGIPFWPVLEDVGVTAWCNSRTLTPKGEFLINELMDRKFIIDVDHMSRKMIDEVFLLAEGRGYPLISGHTALFDMPLVEFGTEGHRTEKHKTLEDIERIRNLGGMISPLPPRKKGSSTHDYVRMYKYALDKMKDGPYGPDHPGIAYGSDIGAMYLQTAPRCPACTDDLTGPCTETCDTFWGRTAPPLQYPFTINGIPGEFHRQETGERKFDFNEDGMAHIGLFPDFIADVEIVGSMEYEDFDLTPLFHSAETYIRMWERIEYCTPDIEPPEPDVDTLPTVIGQCSAEVNNTPTATDQCYCDGPVGNRSYCAGQVQGTTNDPLVYTEQGTYTITWTFDDLGGNSTTQTQTVIVQDTIPPEFKTAPTDLTVECYAIPDPTAIAAFDNCDGSVTPDFLEHRTDGDCPDRYTLTRTWTATDSGGNQSEATQSISVVDTTGPVLVDVPTDQTVECDAVPAEASVTAEDNCDGTGPVVFQEERFDGNCSGYYELSRNWSVTDECDNLADASQSITVQDTTNPTIECPPDVVLECPADISGPDIGIASGSDNCGDVVIDYADVTVAGCGHSETTTRTWTATDECELANHCDQVITVADTTAPVITNLQGAPLVQQVGYAIDFEAGFEDECGAPHVASWDFGDGGDPYVIDQAGSPASARHVYTEPGIYVTMLTVTDDCDNQTSDALVLVVFDPDDPFVTGAYWFIPDDNSHLGGEPLSEKTERARVRFRVGYNQGDSIPEGDLDFRFRAGDIHLQSTRIDWVVNAAEYINCKGLATINGEGEYAFRVTARDQGQPGVGNDEFKIEVWVGDLDTENNPPTPYHLLQGILGGGNIRSNIEKKSLNGLIRP